MTIPIILLFIFGVLELWFFYYNVRMHDENARRSLELDKHEVSLSDMEDNEYVEVASGYLVTESDELKYVGDNAIFNAARNKIAHNIAYDLVHKFPDPDIEEDPFGRRKYSYRFQVRRQ